MHHVRLDLAADNAQYEDLRRNYLIIEREVLGDAVLEAASNAEESTKTGCEAHRLTAFALRRSIAYAACTLPTV
jgi:hypothetical protein